MSQDNNQRKFVSVQNPFIALAIVFTGASMPQNFNSNSLGIGTGIGTLQEIDA
jgi:hypothetical protein